MFSSQSLPPFYFCFPPDLLPSSFIVQPSLLPSINPYFHPLSPPCFLPLLFLPPYLSPIFFPTTIHCSIILPTPSLPLIFIPSPFRTLSPIPYHTFHSTLFCRELEITVGLYRAIHYWIISLMHTRSRWRHWRAKSLQSGKWPCGQIQNVNGITV